MSYNKLVILLLQSYKVYLIYANFMPFFSLYLEKTLIILQPYNLTTLQSMLPYIEWNV